MGQAVHPQVRQTCTISISELQSPFGANHSTCPSTVFVVCPQLGIAVSQKIYAEQARRHPYLYRLLVPGTYQLRVRIIRTAFEARYS